MRLGNVETHMFGGDTMCCRYDPVYPDAIFKIYRIVSLAPRNDVYFMAKSCQRRCLVLSEARNSAQEIGWVVFT
ncbi:hypothetical protein GCM10010970_26430 [Silvimonas iriomotensis]|uniref:Uncharacterized protein n=1 Tax=Silvimonas iriomotensis TaxID=449662 RepID=A0ABQ2PBE2_9NEIS|nr:hypothetical protein GCM10010970_26430 [Silvimonas iriomotensis]